MYSLILIVFEIALRSAYMIIFVEKVNFVQEIPNMVMRQFETSSSSTLYTF